MAIEGVKLCYYFLLWWAKMDGILKCILIKFRIYIYDIKLSKSIFYVNLIEVFIYAMLVLFSR